MGASFNDLDVYVLGHIFGFLSFKKLAKLRRLNSKCHDICMEKLKKKIKAITHYNFLKCTKKRRYMTSTKWFITTFGHNVCATHNFVCLAILRLCASDQLNNAKELYKIYSEFHEKIDNIINAKLGGTYSFAFNEFAECCRNGHYKSIKWLTRKFNIGIATVDHLLTNNTTSRFIQ